MPFRVEGLDHVALNVADQEASERWYRDLLGLEREHAEAWGDTPVWLTSQRSGLALFDAARHGEGTLLVSHIAFRVDRENFEAAQDELRSRDIAFAIDDHGIAHSIYFRDPDGLKLELTTYEV